MGTGSSILASPYWYAWLAGSSMAQASSRRHSTDRRSAMRISTLVRRGPSTPSSRSMTMWRRPKNAAAMLLKTKTSSMISTVSSETRIGRLNRYRISTSSTVTIIRMTSAAAASHSWLRCTQSASLSNRARALMACETAGRYARPRRSFRVFFEELASGLAGLVDRGNGGLDLRRQAALELGDVGRGQRVNLHALLDQFVAGAFLLRL